MEASVKTWNSNRWRGVSMASAREAMPNSPRAARQRARMVQASARRQREAPWMAHQSADGSNRTSQTKMWAGHTRDTQARRALQELRLVATDRKSTRLNSSHLGISYAVF